MPSLYLVLLVLLPALLLAALLGWVVQGKRKVRLARDSAVAETNHESVRKFHYGPAQVPEPLAAAPPLAPNNLLNQLLPEEDFKAKEESDIEEEAARVEAEQMAEREPAPVEAAADESAPALVGEPASVPASVPADEPTAEPATAPVSEPAPVLLSSRHAAGAFDVLALVGNDAPASVGDNAPEPAPVDAAGAESGAVGEEKVAQAIYDNALTDAARTKNDTANRQAAAELRKRKRAAFQAGTDGQKTALTALITETNAPL